MKNSNFGVSGHMVYMYIPIFFITIDVTGCKRKTSIYFPRVSGVVRNGGFGEGDCEDGQRQIDGGQRINSQHDCELLVCENKYSFGESRASVLQPRRRANERR